MGSPVLKINAKDNVIVALRTLPAGSTVEWEGESFYLPYEVGAKHKFVTHDIDPGEGVYMYGVLVGRATQPIKRGEPITTFNLRHDAEDFSTSKRVPYSWTPLDVEKWKSRTFNRSEERRVGRVLSAVTW